MDAAKEAFLFGTVPEGLDPDDPDDRAELLREQAEAELDDDDGVDGWSPFSGLAAQEAVATQIADDDPPDTWRTALRLLDAGLDRRAALHQLTLAMLGEIADVLGEGQPHDLERYTARLARLPLPSYDEVCDAVREVVADGRSLPASEVPPAVAARLGRSDDPEHVELLAERAIHELADDGELDFTVDDVLVAIPALAREAVLTHTLTELEHELGVLTVSFDLALFSGIVRPRTVDGVELTPFSVERGHRAWRGPDGWLAGFEPGTVLAVRVVPAETEAAAAGDAPEGTVTVAIEAVPEPPPVDEELVALVRRTYDDLAEEAGLPVGGDDLLIELAVAGRLESAQAPLSVLCEAAGLEQRGGQVAHAEEVWAQSARLLHTFRLHRAISNSDPDDRTAAMEALSAFMQGEDDPGELRRHLVQLRQPGIDAVADELVAYGAESAHPDWLEPLIERLLSAARRPEEKGVAHFLAAVADEAAGRLDDAEAHLRAAVAADALNVSAVERLAEYRSYRGDAAGALRLLRSVGLAEGYPGVEVLEDVGASGSAGRAEVRRNEPCWCGSGRKYKHCHLGKTEAPPLPDRISWLYTKAVAHLRRSTMEEPEFLALLDAALVDERLEPEHVLPVVVDIALHELGGFERFLHEREALLPDDEAMLLTAWMLVDRSLHEVEEVRPGEGMVVRDLRTGDRVEVRERSFSHHASKGMLLCVRVVPDGAGHQLLLPVPVKPGREKHLIDLLDEGDPFEIAEFLGATLAPPRLATREGEPSVLCDAAVHVPDVAAARRLLDATYEGHGDDEWEEHVHIDGERVRRATIRLDRDLVRVSTHGEARMDRVLEVLRGLEGARVIADDRVPAEDHLARHRRRGGGERDGVPGGVPVGPDGLPLDPVLREALLDHLARYEERWCDLPVPALSGLTPRQAAADPTRREELVRLLNSIPPAPPGSGQMSPQRLRELLGLTH